MRWKCGLLFRLASFWVGVHYSAKTQRYCINLLPCVTFWIAKPGGEVPQGPDFDSTDNPCIVWQPTLRTILTRDDLAEIVAAIKAHNLSMSCPTPAQQSFYRPQSRPWLTPTATNAPCPTCGEPINRAVSDCIYTPVKPTEQYDRDKVRQLDQELEQSAQGNNRFTGHFSVG